MKLSKELLEKAQTAKSPEELIQMAKTENIDLSAEEAAKAFAKLNASGELSDEELDNVAGGCSPSDPEIQHRGLRTILLSIRNRLDKVCKIYYVLYH